MDVKHRVMLAWQDLCAAEHQCFGDSMTFSTVQPILMRMLTDVLDDRNAEITRLQRRADADAATIAQLRAALEEALDEWAYSSDYKGENLQRKHGDRERIAELRELLGTVPHE